MDPMGSARTALDSAQTMIVRTAPRSALPAAALASGGAAQFAAAFFPPPVGMSPPFLGTPSTDILLPGNYPRPLEPSSYHPLHCHYNVAMAKGNSFETEGGGVKKPRTVFTPKQLLHLEEEFLKNQFPNMDQRKLIAKDLELTQQHIQIWFQNRRAKKRRKKKRHSEEEKMRRDPEPPPFWPSNLPFSSNIGDMNKSAEVTPVTEWPSSQITNEADLKMGEKDTSPKPSTDCAPDTDSQQNPTPPLPTSLPLSSEHTNGSTGDSSNTVTTTRPSQLRCNSRDAPLKSPALALTPGNGHSQLPTPPPYVSPITSYPAVENYTGIASMMSHASSADVVLTPPSDLGLQNYPPLPPPESLLNGNFHEVGGFSSTTIGPMCDSAALHAIHTLSARARSVTPLIPPPPPYSSLASCNIILSSQISYTMDHAPSTNIIDPLSLRILPMNARSKSGPLPLPTSETVVLASGGPSSASPTLSPITNSDCSLTDASPLMQDVTLPVPPALQSERGFPSTSSCATVSRCPDNISLQMKGPTLINSALSSLQSATDPVALTDLQEKDWELFSASLCPVIQTDHDMWAADTPQLPPSTFNSKAGPSSRSTSVTGLSSQRYSAAYNVGYVPPYTFQNNYPVTTISNGAK